MAHDRVGRNRKKEPIMNKTYTLFVEGEDAVDFGSKKTAVKYGDLSGKTYQVHSPSGAVVHAVQVEAEAPVEEPEQPEADEATETTDEAVEEPENAEEAVPLAEGGTKFDINALKSKIAKMLAKAERTDNEHERETFLAAAEKMMLRLGINQAELEAAGEVKPEEIVEVVREWRGNYSIVMVPFVHSVSIGFGNITILQSTTSAMLRRTYIIGHKSDVEQFCTLIDSLALQVISALHKWQRENIEERRHLSDMQKYVQHRSFITGFGDTVKRRLYEMRKGEESHASTGAALVLASKMDRISGYVGETYGELKDARGGMKYHSSIAMQDGRVAGRSANLGEKSVGGKKGELQ